MGGKRHRSQKQAGIVRVPSAPRSPARRYNPSQLEHLPVSYQDISDHFDKAGEVPLFLLRVEAIRRIEAATGRPLICYVAKTHNVQPSAPAYIEDADLLGFSDLVQSTSGSMVDVLIISNGGSVEATERIVRLLRNRFTSIRFLVPANA